MYRIVLSYTLCRFVYISTLGHVVCWGFLSGRFYVIAKLAIRKAFPFAAFVNTKTLIKKQKKQIKQKNKT